MELRPIGKRSAAIVLLCAFTFGCSRLPTAPELDTPTVQKGVASSGLNSEILEPLDPLLPNGPPSLVPVLPVEPDTLIRAEDIDGTHGGRVNAGNVVVDVPPGAYHGQAQIKITIPDHDSLMCHLQIFPESMNHFEEPVKVTFDIENFTTDPLHVPGVFWFDEERNIWVQVVAIHDPERKEITADLNHFSQYKVAKASWNKASW